MESAKFSSIVPIYAGNLCNLLPADAGATSDGRTHADNATVRSIVIIGPDKNINAMLVYPMTSGRNFDEVLRLLDSIQLTAKEQVATPVNWKQGDDVVIVPTVSFAWSSFKVKLKRTRRLNGCLLPRVKRKLLRSPKISQISHHLALRRTTPMPAFRP